MTESKKKTTRSVCDNRADFCFFLYIYMLVLFSIGEKQKEARRPLQPMAITATYRMKKLPVCV